MSPDRHAPKAQGEQLKSVETRLRECKGLTGPLHMRSETRTTGPFNCWWAASRNRA